MDIKETNIYNSLRLKKKHLNSIQLTIPLDILRNPNYPKFEKWKAGALVRFYIVDKEKILISLEELDDKTFQQG